MTHYFTDFLWQSCMQSSSIRYVLHTQGSMTSIQGSNFRVLLLRNYKHISLFSYFWDRLLKKLYLCLWAIICWRHWFSLALSCLVSHTSLHTSIQAFNFNLLLLTKYTEANVFSYFWDRLLKNLHGAVNNSVERFVEIFVTTMAK